MGTGAEGQYVHNFLDNEYIFLGDLHNEEIRDMMGTTWNNFGTKWGLSGDNSERSVAYLEQNVDKIETDWRQHGDHMGTI